ncbi:hypothetical protein GCM10025861_11000 [Methanobacterium petrolearium]|nr:hypothetical protein GCM10025861_11000 [Methanobacterium petrolearium]
MILVINNHGQYNHRIHRTLHYLKIPSELVPNTTSLSEIEDKNPKGLILGEVLQWKDLVTAPNMLKNWIIPFWESASVTRL